MATSKKNIPKKISDFLNLAERVNGYWAGPGSWLTLQYTNQPVFSGKVASLHTLVDGRFTEGGARPIITSALDILDHKIDVGVGRVKKYIANKFEDEDPTAYYPSFGIEHVDGKRWIFPTDRDKRLLKLPMMISAIAANGFSANNYGAAYWTAIQSTYGPEWNAAKTTDGSISNEIGNITLLRTDIHEVLISIEDVVKGNFPKTYHEEWRNWGYQREDY